MSAGTQNSFNIATTVVSSLILIFNIIGIYLLKASGIGTSVQIKIIKNLSICDSLISTGTLIIMILNFYGHPLVTSKVAQVIWAHRTGVYQTWFGMFYLLTLDRFLGCNFPFRYRSFASPKKCNIILGVNWGIAIMLTPIFSILDTMKIRLYYNKYLWAICDGIFLFIFTITYVSVFFRKKQSTQALRRQHSGPGNQKFFALTAAILTAFMIFETIPTIISSALTSESKENREVFQHVFELCWNTNLLLDPIIYIFFMPRVRNTALKKLRLLCMLQENRTADLEMNNTTQNTFPAAAFITKDEKDSSVSRC